MGLLDKIRRHAAVATGNFSTLFKDVEIPPLPVAATQLLTEINRPDPDPKRIVKMISASPELAAKVIRTVNSSLFALPNRVNSVQHAVSLLGLRHIKPIAISYTMRTALPQPKSAFFDHQAFWVDSLLRALIARSFANRRARELADEVFTAMLLADVALPVLLSAWEEYYAPVIGEWRVSQGRLSEFERRAFGWDHAQAGAWILQSWGFAEELVCYVSAHNLTLAEIQSHQLDDSLAPLLATAAMIPSLLKPDPARAEGMVQAVTEHLAFTETQLAEIVEEAQVEFRDVLELFELTDCDASDILGEVQAACT